MTTHKEAANTRCRMAAFEAVADDLNNIQHVGGNEMDSRIGILMREGRTIYYAVVNGRYVERYTLDDMEMVLAVRDAKHQTNRRIK